MIDPTKHTGMRMIGGQEDRWWDSTENRARYIVQLRESGLSFEAIGKDKYIQLSRERVRRIYAKATKHGDPQR